MSWFVFMEISEKTLRKVYDFLDSTPYIWNQCKIILGEKKRIYLCSWEMRIQAIGVKMYDVFNLLSNSSE